MLIVVSKGEGCVSGLDGFTDEVQDIQAFSMNFYIQCVPNGANRYIYTIL